MGPRNGSTNYPVDSGVCRSLIITDIKTNKSLAWREGAIAKESTESRETDRKREVNIEIPRDGSWERHRAWEGETSPSPKKIWEPQKKKFFFFFF